MLHIRYIKSYARRPRFSVDLEGALEYATRQLLANDTRESDYAAAIRITPNGATLYAPSGQVLENLTPAQTEKVKAKLSVLFPMLER